MRIYVSGGMTGWPNWNAEAFDEADQALTAQGHDVTTPIELDRQRNVELVTDGWTMGDEEYEGLLDVDLGLISKDNFDAVVFVRGWEQSGGAGREGRKAIDAGLKLFTFAPERADRLMWLDSHEFLRRSRTERLTKDAA